MKRALALILALSGCENSSGDVNPELLTWAVNPACIFICDSTIVDDSAQPSINSSKGAIK